MIWKGKSDMVSRMFLGSRMFHRPIVLFILGLVLVVSLLLVPEVGAKTWVVDDDDGDWADHDNLADAVDDSSAGDTILVYSGTYSMDSVYGGAVVVDQELTIIGNGSSSFLELDGSSPLIAVEGDDVRVEGLRLNGSGSNARGISILWSDNVSIEDCIFDEFNGGGIYLSSSSTNVYVSNCSFLDCGFYERVSNATNAGTTTVVDCTTNGKDIHRYTDQSDIIVPSNAGQVIIINCTSVMVDGLTTNDAKSGLQAYFSSDVTLSNGSFSDQMTGAWIEYCDNVTIENCEIYRMDYFGLKLSDLYDASVSNCRISGPGDSLSIDDSVNVVVENLTFTDTRWLDFYKVEGLQMSNISLFNYSDTIRFSYCEDLLLDGWTYDIFYGIEFDGCGRITVANSRFICNESGDWRGAIQVDRCDDFTIRDTILTSAEGPGFAWEYGGGNLTMENMTISYCKEDPLFIRNLDSVVLHDVHIHNNSEGWGNEMGNNDFLEILNSTFSNNSRVGIKLKSNSSIRNSRFIGNDGTPVFVNGDDNIISWCLFQDNTGYGIDVDGDSNLIHHNTFLENGLSPQISDQGRNPNGTLNNQYDDGSEGNWWSDYQGYDTDDDGVGESPYYIYNDENITIWDRYPLTDRSLLIVDDDPGSWASHTTISSALQNATSNDMILVYSGTYNEKIVVNLPLTIVGNGSSGTTVDAGGSGITLSVMSDDTIISGLSIQGGGSSSNGSGLYAEDVARLRIDECVIENNLGVGLSIVDCIAFRFANSTIRDSGSDAIIVSNSQRAKFRDSTIRRNSGDGLVCEGVTNGTIERCRIIGNSGGGIVLEETSGITVVYNYIMDNDEFAITIDQDSIDNILHHNNAIDNTDDGVEQGLVESDDNYWDDGFYGNYWGDYSGVDSDGNGIGDTPYTFNGSSGSVDLRPLMRRNGTRDPVTLIVDDDWAGADFSSIGDALDAAQDGDEIRIYDGEYHEYINITIAVTIVGNGTTSEIYGDRGPIVQVIGVQINLSDISVTGSNGDSTGLRLESCDNSFLDGIHLSSHKDEGISVEWSSYVSITNITCDHEVRTGIRLQNCDNSTVDNVQCVGKVIGGGGPNGSDSMDTVSTGIYLRWNDNITISNSLLDASSNGIWSYRNIETSIIRNEIKSNRVGIYHHSNINNLIINNTIWASVFGIDIASSDHSSYHGNTITSPGLSIFIQDTVDLTFRNNTLYNGCLFIRTYPSYYPSWSEADEWSSHYIDQSNTIDGNPILYIKNQENVTVPIGGGQIIIANCTKATIRDQTLRDTTYPILIGFTNDSIIKNVTTTKCDYSIHMVMSNDVVVEDCDLNSNSTGLMIRNSMEINITSCDITSKDDVGIYFDRSGNSQIHDCYLVNSDVPIEVHEGYSIKIWGNEIRTNQNSVYLREADNIHIVGNLITRTDRIGIFSRSSDNIVIRNNTIKKCGVVNGSGQYGIEIDDAFNHTIKFNRFVENHGGIYIERKLGGTITIHHNDFIDNRVNTQVYDEYGSAIWHNGSAGNYWSDYDGEDDDDDGIGDTPYYIASDSSGGDNGTGNGSSGQVKDPYPLMEPWNEESSSGENIAPVATIKSVHPSSVDEGDEITFNGTGFDFDGSVALLVWTSSIDGELFNGTSQVWSTSSLSNGTHEITLHSIDNEGLWGERQTANVTVNGIPVARIWTVSKSIIAEGNNVTFTPNCVDDVEITRYVWTSSIDGELYNGTDGTLYTDDLSNGTHTISLKVQDGNGVWSDTVTTTVTVNVRPSVTINSPSSWSTVNGTVTVSGTSSDEDGSIQRIEYQIGDGSWKTATGTTMWSFKWNTSGLSNETYQINIRSYDGNHYSDLGKLYLTVEAEDEDPDEVEPTDRDEDTGLNIPLTSTPAIGAMALIAVLAFGAVASSDRGRYALFAFLPLYSRVKGKDVMKNETRGEIVDYLADNPGAHYQLIKKDLALPNGSLGHHLRILERNGYLKSQTDGFYRRFYPHGYDVPEVEFTRKEKQILRVIASNPGISQRKLAEKMKVTPPAVSYHLKSLKSKGVVRTSRKDGCLVTKDFRARVRK